LELSHLDRLPLELVDLVLRQLDCYDLMYFGFSLPHMWPLVLRHLEAQCYLPALGRWAGTKLITVGEDMPVEGAAPLYPSGLLTNADYKELEDGLTNAELADYGLDPADAEELGAPVNLYDLACARFDEAPGWRRMGLEGLFFQTDIAHHLPHFPQVDPTTSRQAAQIHCRRLHARRMLSDFRDYTLADFYPPDQAWVLRNLTTKEIVRADSLAQRNWEDPQGVRHASFGPFVNGRFTFGCVEFARTSWSTYMSPDAPGQERYDCLDYNRRRGVWAGHRFDITTAERHEQQLQAMEAEERAAWRDVGQEVAREMKLMWNCSGGGGYDDEPGDED
jgi:hypothetical protein